MNRFFALVAFVGLVLAAAVHVAAVAGIDVTERIPLVWLPHVGIFVVFIPFIFSARKVLGAKPSLSDIRALLPGWVILAGAALLIYVIINFAIFVVSTQGGSPLIQEGKYVLQNHGQLIREISQAEYTTFQANELRGFSGHWLVFYFIPFAYFMFAKKPNE
jgi:hypothetical protein